ncbi:MAG: hypothetical protein AAB229_00105 [Candidatus Hydrogenedentota bacterium]
MEWNWKNRKYLPSLLLPAFVFSPPVLGPVRLGDLLAAAVLAWFIPSWIRARAIRLNAMEKIYLTLLMISSVAALISLATGMNERGAGCALMVGRLAELAVLYCITAHCSETAGTLRMSAVACIVLLLAWSLGEMAYIQFFTVTEYHRVFNSGVFSGEANHVAGALVILSVFATASIGASSWPALASFVSILLSGSRASFAAAAVSHGRILIVMRRYRELLLVAAVGLALLVFAPYGTISRWKDILQVRRDYSGPHVDRLTSWTIVLRETPVLTGAGPGSRPSSVYESCYMMFYAESGLCGLAAYVALMGAMIFTRNEYGLAKHVVPALGVALAVLSLSANALIIARVAGAAAIILGAVRAPSRS